MADLNDPKTAIDFCEWLCEHYSASEWIDDAAFDSVKRGKNPETWMGRLMHSKIYSGGIPAASLF
jgi:hypothetical protein